MIEVQHITQEKRKSSLDVRHICFINTHIAIHPYLRLALFAKRTIIGSAAPAVLQGHTSKQI